MPRLAAVCALLAAAFALAASAASAAPMPKKGFVVFKDLGRYAITEVRDKGGRIVSSEIELGEAGGETACQDLRHTFVGPRWKLWERYFVNMTSLEGVRASATTFLSASEILDDLRASHDAWQSPFVTDCTGVIHWSSPYQARYGGDAQQGASLLGLETDGVNVVEFRSLENTMCDGAAACTIFDYEGSTILEADIVFEKDLTRRGFQDYWTTGDTSWWNATSGQYAIVDTATHEFGHFAGLGHVNSSPSLTMFPVLTDGAQTLGLGDMKGLTARYQ